MKPWRRKCNVSCLNESFLAFRNALPVIPNWASVSSIATYFVSHRQSDIPSKSSAKSVRSCSCARLLRLDLSLLFFLFWKSRSTYSRAESCAVFQTSDPYDPITLIPVVQGKLHRFNLFFSPKKFREKREFSLLRNLYAKLNLDISREKRTFIAIRSVPARFYNNLLFVSVGKGFKKKVSK